MDMKSVSFPQNINILHPKSTLEMAMQAGLPMLEMK
jgi:hypothetical protein